MRKLMRNRKAMAWVVLMTFLFTCVVPTGNVALAANNDMQPYIYGSGVTKYDIVKINDSDGSFASYSTEGENVVIGLNEAESIQVHIPSEMQEDMQAVYKVMKKILNNTPKEKQVRTFTACMDYDSEDNSNNAVVNAKPVNMNKITNDPNDGDSDHFYVLYKNIGNYNGTSIDLKVSIAAYAAIPFDNIEKDSDGKTENNKNFGYTYLIGLETTSKKPGIAVAGIESVTLKYEFLDSKGDSITVKGSTSYYDVDAGQGVKVDATCEAIYMVAGVMENVKNINGIKVSKDTCALAVSETVPGYHIKDVTDEEAHLVENNPDTGGHAETGYLNAAFSEGFIGATLNRTFTFKDVRGVIRHSGVSTVRTTTIEGAKTWLDGDNQDGIRPDSITVRLLANGTPVEGQVAIVQADQNGNWTYKFEGLPVYNDSYEKINYTVTEDVVTGYLEPIINDFDITNIQATEVNVEKVWEDENDKYQNRPDEITVKLLADGNVIQEEKLSTANGWQHVFSNLPKYDSETGKLIEYTVKEDDVPVGYTAVVDGNMAEGFIIRNTLETTSIIGTKTWVDDNDATKRKPITLILDSYVNGDLKSTTKQAFDLQNGGTYEFKDLPKYLNGELINYVVTESEVKGYKTIYDADNKNNIINIKDDHESLLTNLHVTKVWEGDENALDKRPESILLQLKVNGKTTDSAIELETNGTNTWECTFKDLPKYGADGRTNVYTVEELDVPEGYVSAVVVAMAGEDIEATITNKLCAGDEGEFTVSKKVTGNTAPAAAHAYKFKLEVEATSKEWSALLVSKLNDLKADNEEATANQYEAEEAFKNAETLFKENAKVYSTGAAYQFVMKAETTSPGVYRYTFIKDDKAFAKTTESAYFFNPTDEVGNADGILDQLVEGIKALASKFTGVTNPASFLESLKEQVILGDNAVEFEEEHANDLLTAAGNLFDAQRQVEATSASVFAFEKQNVPTTPAAITLVMTPITYDADGTAQEGETVTENLLPTAENKYFDGEKYIILFNLLKDMDYRFAIEATTGTSIQYVVKEVDGYLTADDTYLHTMISTSDKKDSKESRETDKIALTNNSEHSLYMFTNVYKDEDKDNTTTQTETTIPEEKPPTGGTEPTPEPEFIIPGENVPKGDAEPDDELNDPDIPLGDAPPTGDTNNAIPFVVLMMAAVAGLVVTRRKFN